MFKQITKPPQIIHRDNKKKANIEQAGYEFSLSQYLNNSSVKKGHLSALRNKGLIVGSSDHDIDLAFSASRYDSRFKTDHSLSVNNETLEENGPFYQGISTFTGRQISSTEWGSGTIGTYWGKNKLSSKTNIINVVNGMSGTVGIKIPLCNIKENNPLLITSGALSGCTMVYAVDDENFYAFHTGQEPGAKDWKTGIQGPETMYKVADQLSGKITQLRHKEHNNGISDILENYKKGMVTYFGKPGAHINKHNRNTKYFDYNESKSAPFEIRAGYSYALITMEGNLPKVKVLSEDVKVNPKDCTIKILASAEERLL